MQLRELGTEHRNPASRNMDRMSSLELVSLMNREDAKVPRAIRRALPAIAKAVDLIAQQLAKGGRLIYVGTGTSGRIGALDASECPPTFDTDPKMVRFLVAGGERALAHATEASEDSSEQGRKDMAKLRPGKKDVVVGIAASGRTPYTVGAVRLARSKGAVTVGIACNPGSALAKAAEHKIEVIVGPEVLTGSSRMKAGTAQKLICNMLSTGAMAQLGYVYSNLMVNMHTKNEKLRERGIAIVETLAGVSRAKAIKTLKDAEMSLPVALVMLMAGATAGQAKVRLRKVKGNVRKAIEG